MKNDELSTKPWRRKGHIAILLMLGAVIVVGLDCFAAIRKVDKSLDREKELARREGIPLVPDDLRKKPIDESENAAPMLAQAFSVCAAHEHFNNELSTGILDPRILLLDLRGAEPALTTAGPAIALFRRAAQKPFLDFHRRWELGAVLTLPEYSDMRVGVRLLVVDADHKLRAGDIDGAFAELVDAAKLSNLTTQDPTVIATLVGVSNAMFVENELERAIWRLGKQQSLFPRVANVIKALGPPVNLRHSIAAEVVFSMMAGESLAKDSPSEVLGTGSNDDQDDSGLFGGNSNSVRLLRLAKFEPIRHEMEAHMVKFWRELYSSLPVDGSDTVGAMKAMKEADVRALRATDLSDAMVQVFAPVFAQAASVVGEEFARRRTLLSLAAWLDRRNKGEKVPDLSSLKDSFMDPFTLKPLIIKLKRGGVVIYSVGPDSVDDGGVRRVPGTAKMMGYDVVSEYPAPAAARTQTPKEPHPVPPLES